MAEVKFCLKALVASIFIVMALQIHVGNYTIEQHAQNWMMTSPIAGHLDKVATGAALAVRNASKSVSQMTSQAFGSSERASRLNLEFQRSPSALKSKKINQQQDE